MRDHRTRLCGILLTVALFVGGLCSCASYTTRLRELRTTVAGGRLDSALQQVDKVSQPGELLYHLERGALLHYNGNYDASNLDFERAESLLDELYTISVSRRALTFVLNDEVEPYRGEIHEANYLHYYRILNYLAQGQGGEAAVEARRLAHLLVVTRGERKDDPLQRDDPFLEYLVGLVLESVGEWNNALIAYRLAHGAREDWRPAAGEIDLPGLTSAMLRNARRAGIAPAEIPELADLDPALPVAAGAEEAAAGGRILVLFESGWTPGKESVHLRVPILESDPDWEGEDGARSMGWVLAERTRYHHLHGHWEHQNVKVAYFLDVAVPVLRDEPQSEVRSCRVSAYPVVGEGDAAGTPFVAKSDIPATRLSILTRRAFESKQLAILAKTCARALLKYAAKKKAEKQLGGLAGVLANVAGVATEKADTRAWLLLPDQIFVAELRLPPGTYRLVIEALDGSGRRLEATEDEVVLAPRGVRLLSWRSFI